MGATSSISWSEVDAERTRIEPVVLLSFLVFHVPGGGAFGLVVILFLFVPKRALSLFRLLFRPLFRPCVPQLPQVHVLGQR